MYGQKNIQRKRNESTHDLSRPDDSLQHSRPIYFAFIVVVHGNTGNLCDGIHERLIGKAEVVTASEILLLVEILENCVSIADYIWYMNMI